MKMHAEHRLERREETATRRLEKRWYLTWKYKNLASLFLSRAVSCQKQRSLTLPLECGKRRETMHRPNRAPCRSKGEYWSLESPEIEHIWNTPLYSVLVNGAILRMCMHYKHVFGPDSPCLVLLCTFFLLIFQTFLHVSQETSHTCLLFQWHRRNDALLFILDLLFHVSLFFSFVLFSFFYFTLFFLFLYAPFCLSHASLHLHHHLSTCRYSSFYLIPIRVIHYSQSISSQCPANM